MASFIGGEALARVVRYEVASLSAGTTNVHTIPAGRYARVFISLAPASDFSLINLASGSNNIAIWNAAGVPAEVDAGSGSSNFFNYFPEGAIYNETDIVRYQAGPGAGGNPLQIMILEYNKPDTLNLP